MCMYHDLTLWAIRKLSDRLIPYHERFSIDWAAKIRANPQGNLMVLTTKSSSFIQLMLMDWPTIVHNIGIYLSV